MVQIISAPTTRQQAFQAALEQGASSFGQGLSKGYAEAQQTKRQEALSEQASNEKAAQSLALNGYEVNPQNISLIRGKDVAVPVIQQAQAAIPAQAATPGQAESFQSPNSLADIKQQEEGRLSQVMSSQVPGVEGVAARPEILGPKPQLTYTANKQAEIDLKTQDSTQQRTLREAQIKDLQNKGPRSALQDQKTLAEIKKLEAESRPETAQKKLGKMSAEAQGKVGALASGVKALKDLSLAIRGGSGPEYIDVNTPIIGGFKSDTPFTAAQRVVSEVIGRLQSGGAIGEKEMATFNNMSPRPGDSPEISERKVKNQMSFLENKLTAFGLNEKDLTEAGFDIGASEQPVATTKDHLKTAKGMTRQQKLDLINGK